MHPMMLERLAAERTSDMIAKAEGRQLARQARVAASTELSVRRPISRRTWWPAEWARNTIARFRGRPLARARRASPARPPAS